MAVFKLDRLVQRSGRLYYRRRVPKDVQNALDRTEWKYSLKLPVGMETAALKLCKKYDAQTDHEIELARSGADVTLANSADARRDALEQCKAPLLCTIF